MLAGMGLEWWGALGYNPIVDWVRKPPLLSEGLSGREACVLWP